MRLKGLASFSFILLTGLSFTACSLPANIIEFKKQGEAVIPDEKIAMADADLSYLSAAELQMLKLQYLEETAGISKEEYLALADLYREVGLVKEERDILEKAYRLFEDESLFEMLENIAVDITEENDDIQALISNVDGEDALLELLGREDFEDIFLPKLHDGKRTYYAVKDGKIVLLMEVGANSAKVYGIFGGNRGIYAEQGNYTLTLLAKDCSSGADVYSMLSENKNASFKKTTIDLYNGSFAIEEGTMNGGKLAGVFTVKTGTFDAYNMSFSDAVSKLPTMNFTEYCGEFDDSGRTLEEELPESDISVLSKTEGMQVIVYAYSKDKKNCLFKEVPSKDYCFDTDFLNISPAKVISSYEVKDKTGYSTELVKDIMGDSVLTVSNESQKVRVYDGEVQYFDGTKWISCGTVESLSEKDPFSTYSAKVAKAEVPVDVPKAIVDSAEVPKKEEVASVASNKPSASNKKPLASTPAAPKTTTPGITAPAAQTPVSPVTEAPSLSDPASSTPAPSNPAPSTPSTPEPSHTDPTPSAPSEPQAPNQPSSGDTDVSAGALDDDDDSSSSSDPGQEESPGDEWSDNLRD